MLNDASRGPTSGRLLGAFWGSKVILKCFRMPKCHPETSKINAKVTKHVAKKVSKSLLAALLHFSLQSCTGPPGAAQRIELLLSYRFKILRISILRFDT